MPNEHVSEVREWFGPTQEDNESLNLVYPPTPVVEAAEAGPAHIGQAQEPGSPTPPSLDLSDYESLPEAPAAPHAPSERSESYDPNDYDPPALLQIQQELAPLFVPERVVDWLVEGLVDRVRRERIREREPTPYHRVPRPRQKKVWPGPTKIRPEAPEVLWQFEDERQFISYLRPRRLCFKVKRRDRKSVV